VAGGWQRIVCGRIVGVGDTDLHMIVGVDDTDLRMIVGHGDNELRMPRGVAHAGSTA
jgi:hypothetical protein